MKAKDKTSDFAELLEKSGFAQVWVQQGPYTVRVPTNEALIKGNVDVEAANENRKQAQRIVQRHLYQGEISVEEIESTMDISIESKDELPSNGVVYFINDVVIR